MITRNVRWKHATSLSDIADMADYFGDKELATTIEDFFSKLLED